MDQQLRAGSHWPRRLAEALATCRVFVPLYSRRYFASDQCGREWFAFSRRAQNHIARSAQHVEAIVPALWVPVRPAELPEAARSIQFDHSAFGDRYSVDGFYGVIRLSRYRSEYEEAVYQLARRIVEVAHRTRIAPATPVDYESLESAFGLQDRYQRDRRLRVTVVAPHATDLPEGRTDFYYGPTPREWNPYRPDSVRPIAEHAAALAKDLGYRPEVDSFDESVSDLLADEPPTCPGLLLVDAWATTDPGRQESLRQLDELGKPWVSVMVPWNRQDRETAEADNKLKHSLDASLRRKLADGRITSRTSVGGLPSLEEFGMALPAMVSAATRQYLKRAHAYPPDGPVIERPRLSGPEAIMDPGRHGEHDERSP